MTTSRRGLVAVADVLMAVTIVTVLVIAAVVIVRQRAYDGAAADIATWSRDRGVERVAWPADLRQAVPVLLDAGVVPVLMDGPVPAQQYAIAQTGVVVQKVGSPVPEFEVASHRVGDLIAYEVVLEEAGSVPLAVGESVFEEISRKYRYAPLYASEVIPPGGFFERDVYLGPGRYEVAIEAFVGFEAVAYQTDILVVLMPAVGEAVSDGGGIGAVVDEPMVFEFVLADGTSPQVELAIGPTGAEGSPDAMLHGWSITRLADR